MRRMSDESLEVGDFLEKRGLGMAEVAVVCATITGMSIGGIPRAEQKLLTDYVIELMRTAIEFRNHCDDATKN
jgi:hypothetical protein